MPTTTFDDLAHCEVHGDLMTPEGQTMICPTCVRLSAYDLRRDKLAALVSAYVSAEAELPSRHHGVKGRQRVLISQIRTVVDVDAALLSRWIDWAVATKEMHLTGLDADDIGRVLADTWINGWTVNEPHRSYCNLVAGTDPDDHHCTCPLGDLN